MNHEERDAEITHLRYKLSEALLRVDALRTRLLEYEHLIKQGDARWNQTANEWLDQRRTIEELRLTVAELRSGWRQICPHCEKPFSTDNPVSVCGPCYDATRGHHP